jgi:hypothetical protein
MPVVTEHPHDVSADDLRAVDEIHQMIRELPFADHERVERALAFAAVAYAHNCSTTELAAFLDSLIVTVSRHRDPQYLRALAGADEEDWGAAEGATADDLVAAARRRRVEQRRLPG